MGGEPQRQRERPLLSLGGVGARGETVDLDQNVVAMRPHGGDSATDVVGTGFVECRTETAGLPRRLVRQLERGGLVGQGLVGLVHVRREAGHEGRPCVAEAVPDVGEALIPDVERGLDLLGEVTAGLLEQGVALAQDAVQFDPQRVVLGRQRHQRVVEEAPSAARAVLDDAQIVRREHGHSDRAEQITDPGQPLSIDQDAAASDRGDLRLDERLPAPVVANGCPNDRRVGSRPDQSLRGGTAKAGECRQIGESFGQVGLALAVVTQNDGDPRS